MKWFATGGFLVDEDELLENEEISSRTLQLRRESKTLEENNVVDKEIRTLSTSDQLDKMELTTSKDCIGTLQNYEIKITFSYSGDIFRI